MRACCIGKKDLVQGQLKLEILQTGYRFELGSENATISNCSTSEIVELPEFDGLKNIILQNNLK